MPGWVDPTGRPRMPRRPVRSWRTQGEMRGALGLLDNGKRNALQLLQAVAEELRDDLPAAEVLVRTKPSSSLPASEDVLEELASGCAVVIAGVGD